MLLAFTQLNPVVFTQYYFWLLIAVLLALAESLPKQASAAEPGPEASPL
jgi:hypothetical protein